MTYYEVLDVIRKAAIAHAKMPEYARKKIMVLWCSRIYSTGYHKCSFRYLETPFIKRSI